MRGLLTILWRAVWAAPFARAEEGDAALVARLADRDASAMAALYDRHGRAVYSLALRIVRDPADAEDVAQEVFSQAWRQAGRYARTRGAVAAWLLNITRSRAIDRLRTRRPGAVPVPHRDDESVAQHFVADTPPPDVLAAHGAAAARVRQALDELPLLQRVAIELAYFEGLSQSEIAEKLEQPLGTVKTRVRQGLLRLRDALTGTV